MATINNEIKSKAVVIDTSNEVKFSSVAKQMRPFDLLGFRGGGFWSDFISKMEEQQTGNGSFTHVGMVVTSEILPYYTVNNLQVRLRPNHPYVFESQLSYPGVSDGVPDVFTKKGHLGVQLRDLDEVLPKYITNPSIKIAWCPLTNNPFDRQPGESEETLNQRRLILRSTFMKLFNKYEGRLYEVDLEGLAGGMFPRLRIIREIRDRTYKTVYTSLHRLGLAKHNYGPTKWQFCSELVANVYHKIGVLDQKYSAKDVIPPDFFGYDQDGMPAIVEKPIFLLV